MRDATSLSLRSTSSSLLTPSGREGSGGINRTTRRRTHAGTSRTWFHNHGVDVIDFPPWSSDLNPIELLWNDLKRRVYAHHPQTMEELEHFIVVEWQATDLNFLLAHLPQHAAAPATCASE